MMCYIFFSFIAINTHNIKTCHLDHLKVAFSTFIALYIYLIQNISTPQKIPFPLAVAPHAHPSDSGNH